MMNTLLQRVYPVSRQRLEYLELLVDATGSRFRVTVSSDSHQDQSFARLERWDGAQWQLVASLPGPAMVTKAGLAYRADADVTAFKADRDELVALTLLIVGTPVKGGV